MTTRGKDWLTVRDAARVAGVHPNTVRGWLREGRVRAELGEGRHGPTYRIPAEDVAGQAPDGEAGGGLVLGHASVSARSDVSALIERLAAVEDARVEEARARARAEAKLEELDDLRRRLEEALAEITSLREQLAERTP